MAKVKNHEEAVAALETATQNRKAASKAKEDYAKENGLTPKKNHSEDKKHGKAWKKLHATYLAAKEAEEAAKKTVRELKPATVRATKYEYPADVVTTADKKKFRAQARAASNAENKPKKEKVVKEAKKSKVEAAPVEKSSKKDKKAKKAAPVEAAPAAKSDKKSKKAKKAKKEAASED